MKKKSIPTPDARFGRRACVCEIEKSIARRRYVDYTVSVFRTLCLRAIACVCHLFVQVADQQHARLSGHLIGQPQRARRERGAGQREPERHVCHGRVGKRRGQRRRESVDGIERRRQHARATCEHEKHTGTVLDII